MTFGLMTSIRLVTSIAYGRLPPSAGWSPADLQIAAMSLAARLWHCQDHAVLFVQRHLPASALPPTAPEIPGPSSLKLGPIA